jgi:hypothetical protein
MQHDTALEQLVALQAAVDTSFNTTFQATRRSFKTFSFRFGLYYLLISLLYALLFFLVTVQGVWVYLGFILEDMSPDGTNNMLLLGLRIARMAVISGFVLLWFLVTFIPAHRLVQRFPRWRAPVYLAQSFVIIPPTRCATSSGKVVDSLGVYAGCFC